MVSFRTLTARVARRVRAAKRHTAAAARNAFTIEFRLDDLEPDTWIDQLTERDDG